jgi:hypothetical protein
MQVSNQLMLVSMICHSFEKLLILVCHGTAYAAFVYTHNITTLLWWLCAAYE